MILFSLFKNLVKTLLLTLALSLGGDETAIFAGGCFWCVQHDFDQVPGVISTTAGYTGGDVENPSYSQVSSGKTGHVEAVQVVFDPNQVTYNQLLDFYWRNVDPTRNDGQFCDKGTEYRPVIYYINEEQKQEAEASKNALIKSKKVKPVLVEILPAKTFYPAEDYHQEYYQKNPLRYQFYRSKCGRDKRLKKLWGSA